MSMSPRRILGKALRETGSSLARLSKCMVWDFSYYDHLSPHQTVVPFGDGDTPTISPTSFVSPSATVVGDVAIGSHAKIDYGAILYGPKTAVGDNAFVGVNVVLDEGATIGDGAIVGDNSVVTRGTAVFRGACVGDAPCDPYVIRRVNKRTTRCPDGSPPGESCDVSGFASDGAEAFDVEAVFALWDVVFVLAFRAEADGKGVLFVERAWAGERSAAWADDKIVLLTGVPCIRAPCRSKLVAVLNSNQESIGKVDYAVDAIPAARAGFALGAGAGVVAAAVLRGSEAAVGAVAFEVYDAAEGLQLCGSRGLAACGKREFCKYSATADCGRGDAAGICTVPPDVCAALYAPVCGCDGATYSSACHAAAAGASVDHKRAC
ncbi:hypothetical protein M885DRAFT_587117 [Pelagophyceae sp. CCMP2097]|nr:hypothetical protein M885DRAFT_587117 [Pelagophyceae sp. CCMP2097]